MFSWEMTTCGPSYYTIYTYIYLYNIKNTLSTVWNQGDTINIENQRCLYLSNTLLDVSSHTHHSQSNTSRFGYLMICRIDAEDQCDLTESTSTCNDATKDQAMSRQVLSSTTVVVASGNPNFE